MNSWFGTRFGGVSRFNGVRFTNFSTSNGLSNNFIGPMWQDKTGKIWLGTAGGGICRINPTTIGQGPNAVEHFGISQGIFNQHVQRSWQINKAISGSGLREVYTVLMERNLSISDGRAVEN